VQPPYNAFLCWARLLQATIYWQSFQQGACRDHVRKVHYISWCGTTSFRGFLGSSLTHLTKTERSKLNRFVTQVPYPLQRASQLNPILYIKYRKCRCELVVFTVLPGNNTVGFKRRTGLAMVCCARSCTNRLFGQQGCPPRHGETDWSSRRK